MKIAVIGTGYVGLVTGTCFAERGNDVICIDNNAQKVEQMRAGTIPIFEPGLEDLFKRTVQEQRLSFSTELKEALSASVIFLALPTPQGADGSADLSFVKQVAGELAGMIKEYVVIVNKSTVPVGTARQVHDILAAKVSPELFDVVSNPEFLREGQAVDDFMSPERVVVGTDSDAARRIMQKLYAPFVHRGPEGRLMFMDTASAELTKYAANAMLATKISFMNGLTALCEATGADIGQIRKGIGSDSRIGSQFLYAGPGYGGSCFPKDTHALLKTSQDYGVKLDLVQATIDTNERQKLVIPEKIAKYYDGKISGKKFALWGLAFKDNTDDIRDSPALTIIEELTKKGAEVVSFDPQAMGNVQKQVKNDKLSYASNEYEVLKDADALVIATNWREFSTPDFSRIKSLLKYPVIFDCRNMYEPNDMAMEGFYYESIGRKTVK